MRPEWSYQIERTEYSDMVFSKIGRLLHVATVFESYCKSIYSLLTLKLNPNFLSDAIEFDKFSKELTKLNLNGYINKSFISPESKGVKDVLHLAREGRNEVAHELTNSLNHTFSYHERELELEQRIDELAKNIVEGEFLCIWILSILTKDEAPNEKFKLNRLEWIIND